MLIREIQAATARHFDLTIRDLIGETVRPKLTEASPAHVGMFLSREVTRRSYAVIARKFGRSDHTTARHAYYRTRRILETNPAFAAKVEAIREELAA